MSLPPHHRLGSYEIVAVLGAGGMGEVYRARDTRLGREVALKILRAEVTTDAARLARFDREARTVAALNHPHIVTLYSSESVDGMHFLTMELVDGCTLVDMIAPGGLSVPQFLEIALPLADALAAAHQKQITHRDLKPGNVMISREGRVKVLDFGLASAGAPDDFDQTMAPLTREGMVLGTMPYMSPEQVEGLPVDPRSDLFSLGIIFYEMLIGERPFRGASAPALISSILRDRPPAVGATRTDVPVALGVLIDRMLNKRVDARVQTAREVHYELQNVQRALGGMTSLSGAAGFAGPHHPTTEMPRLNPPSSTMRDALGTTVSVAIRPFRGGSHPDASAIADGLTTDIGTRMAKFGYLRIISPDAIDQQPPPAGERYVVEGDVRASATAVRVSVRLVDLATTTQVWAQNYDHKLEDGTFEIIDSVADRTAANIADSGGELMRAIAASNSAAAQSPSVRFGLYARNFTADEHARLRDTFEALVAENPGHKGAWAYLSLLYCHEITFGFNVQPDPIARARHAAERAIAVDAGNQRAWFAQAMAAFLDHDVMAFRSSAERALELNPLSAVALATLGMFYCYSGDARRGAELVRKAMPLNQHRPGWYNAVLFCDAFMSGNAEAALTHANLITMPHLPTSGLFVAAAAGRFGHADEARRGVESWMRANEGQPFDLAQARQILLRWMWEGPLLDGLMDGLGKARDLAAAPRSASSPE